MARLALGVLVSGNGSNLQAILDAVAGGRLDVDVKLVISNQPDAFALERAKRARVPHECVSHRNFGSREDFDRQLVERLQAAGCEWVALAGFMRILTPIFLDAFRDRVLNIHPALLPAFPGVNAAKQALEHGVKVTGCTVHLVDEQMDAGPIIAQTSVVIDDGDDEQRLLGRIHAAEHELYVATLQRLAHATLVLEKAAGGRRRAWLRSD